MSVTEIANIDSSSVDRADLDEYIARVAIDRTIGDMVRVRSSSPNVRSGFVSNLVVEAVFGTDIGLISEIVKRIDGLAPAKGDMDAYSNIFADALADVLDYEHGEDATVYPSDPVIVALAKATVYVAGRDVGKNVQLRKDRQRATQMILDRMGGRRSEPARNATEIEYVEPEWMGLPEGGRDGRHGEAGDHPGP